MDLQAVCVDNHARTADRTEVKASFPFFDEIFHFTSATVKLQHLVGSQFFHCSNNEGVSVDYLSIGLFYLEYNPAGMAP